MNRIYNNKQMYLYKFYQIELLRYTRNEFFNLDKILINLTLLSILVKLIKYLKSFLKWLGKSINYLIRSSRMWSMLDRPIITFKMQFKNLTKTSKDHLPMRLEISLLKTQFKFIKLILL